MAKRSYEKPTLYRKVNTRARGVRHRFGGDHRHDRNTKSEQEAIDEEHSRGSMGATAQRGLDYTPLFRFLLSREGEDWDEVFSEASSRLDRTEPIFWMVALHEEDRCDTIRVGESTFFSGMYVDEEHRLRRVRPDLGPEHMVPTCQCCTHTLNGVPFAGPKKDES